MSSTHKSRKKTRLNVRFTRLKCLVDNLEKDLKEFKSEKHKQGNFMNQLYDESLSLFNIHQKALEYLAACQIRLETWKQDGKKIKRLKNKLQAKLKHNGKNANVYQQTQINRAKDVLELITERKKSLVKFENIVEDIYKWRIQINKEKIMTEFRQILMLEPKTKPSWKVPLIKLKWTVKKLKCPICYEIAPKIAVLPCTHSYCIDCLKTYLQTEISTDHADEIRCPDPDCRKIHHFSEWIKILNNNESPNNNNNPNSIWIDNLEKTYYQSRFRLELVRGQKLSSCPLQGCNGYTVNYQRQDHVNCMECQSLYCFICREIHATKNECNDLDYKNRSNSVFVFSDGTEYRRCPRCQRPSDKITGCNDVKCPCGCRWSYDTLKVR